MSSPRPNDIRVISQAEYKEGEPNPLHPKCLAQSEIYVARLRTSERKYYAVEFAQVIMQVETIEDGYLVTTANPHSHSPITRELAWRLDNSGLRYGLASRFRPPQPDGYFVAGRDAWDDDLTALLRDELILS